MELCYPFRGDPYRVDFYCSLCPLILVCPMSFQFVVSLCYIPKYNRYIVFNVTHVCPHLCTYVYIYILYLYICIYVYIYVYTYEHIHNFSADDAVQR